MPKIWTMSSRVDDDAAAQRKRTAFLAGGIALIALIVVVGLVLASQAEDDVAEVDSDELFAGIEQEGFSLGDTGAPVTVVEFADLQCPFCADFATEDLPGIVESYVEPGDVRMELRLLDFIGEDSTAGALAAGAAAAQDRIWPFAENVYSNQGAENTGYITTDFIEEQASAVDGLDASKLLADSAASQAQSYLESSVATAADAGVDSTPSFLVGPTGGELELIEDPGDLESSIDEALAQAGQ